MLKRVMLFAATSAASLTAMSASAQTAQTITFSNLPFGNPAVTSYAENGLTFNVTAGSFNGTSGNGLPAPSVYTPTNSGTALVTSGGLFNFLSISLGNGAFNGTANFAISGLLGGASLFTFNQSVSALQFNTYIAPTVDSAFAIDALRIQVTGDGNLDNISVRTIAAVPSAVPEPATWGMMMLGIGAIGFAVRRQRKVKTTVQFA